MDWISTLFLFFGSLIANTLASLAGGGAGLLQFPLLIFLGLPFGVALATHKLASVALGLGAAYTHLKSGKIKLTTAFYLILTGSIGVIIGANIVLLIPSNIAEFMLGIMILLLGVYSRFKKQLGQEEKPRNRELSGWLLGGVGLLLIGIINGFSHCRLWIISDPVFGPLVWLRLQASRCSYANMRRFLLERYWWYCSSASWRTCSLALATHSSRKLFFGWRTWRMDDESLQ